jgi:hypothetical protein
MGFTTLPYLDSSAQLTVDVNLFSYSPYNTASKANTPGPGRSCLAKCLEVRLPFAVSNDRWNQGWLADSC